jgi:hypothetical protein
MDTREIERLCDLRPPQKPRHSERSPIHSFRDYQEEFCDLCSVEVTNRYGSRGSKGHRACFAVHEAGKKHTRKYSELEEMWREYRMEVEVYSRDRAQRFEVALAGKRALLSKQNWLAASKITCHIPWQEELKSALFDFEHSDGDMDESKFNQVAKSIDKNERLALVLLIFIRERVTCSGKISLFEVRQPDFVFGSSRPWAQEISRIISTEGHIISNRVQVFL